MKKSKILLIEGRSSIGGGQVITRKIISALNNDYDVDLFCPNNCSVDFLKMFSDINVYEYKQLEYSLGNKSFCDYFKFILNSVLICFSLCKLIHKSEYCLLYVQHPRCIPIVTILALFFNKKVIAHIHVVHESKIVKKLINICLCSKVYVNIVGVSKHALSQFYNIEDKSIVLYNCVDNFSLKSIAQSNTINIAVIADVIFQKRQDLVCEAVQYLKNKENLSINIHFAGPIIDPAFKKYIEEKYLNSIHFSFYGRLNDINNFLNDIDIVIIPSYSETFSLAMVEAWSKGIMTIASDISGMKELVDKNFKSQRNLFLFPYGDAKSLARKIHDYYNMPFEIKQGLSNNLHAVVSKYYSFDKFQNSIINVITNAIH